MVGAYLAQYVMTRHNRDLPGPHDAIALQNVEGLTIYAGELWKTQPVLILALRRLGCSMLSALTTEKHVRSRQACYRAALLLQFFVELKLRSCGQIRPHSINWGYGWCALCIRCQSQSTRCAHLQLSDRCTNMLLAALI